jgi:hypothetical protein
VAREGEGKSGGFRTIVFFRYGDRAILTFGFAKSDKANLASEELVQLKASASGCRSYSL